MIINRGAQWIFWILFGWIFWPLFKGWPIIARAIRNGVNYTERATRYEYWGYSIQCLVYSLGSASLAIVLYMDYKITFTIFVMISLMTGLFIILQYSYIALATRRLHDIGKSGWWQLMMFTGIGIPILIYWYSKDSTPEDNEYGKYKSANEVKFEELIRALKTKGDDN